MDNPESFLSLPILLSFLEKNTNFSLLDFTNTAISDKKAFFLCISKLLLIETLILSGNDLHKNLDFLLIFLRKATKLKVLELKNVKIDDSDFQILANILKENLSIKSLDLAGNTINNLGASQIFLALQQNTRLLKLNLNNNGDIRHDILGDIQRVLQRNKLVILQENKENSIEIAYFSEEKKEENGDFSNRKNEGFIRKINENLEEIHQDLREKADFLKKVCSKELEIERIRQKDQENELNRLKEITTMNETRKKEVSLRFNALVSENSLLKAENQALYQEFLLIDKKTQQNFNFFDTKLSEKCEETGKIAQKNHAEFLRFYNEKTLFIEDISHDFERKYEKLLEIYRHNEEKKAFLDRKIVENREENINYSMQFEEDSRNLLEKALIEENKRYFSLYKARENELLDLKNELKFNEIRNKELKSEVLKVKSRFFDKIAEKEKENNKEKLEINELHHKLSQINLEIQRKKLENCEEDQRNERFYRVLCEIRQGIDQEKFEMKFNEEKIHEQHINEEILWKGAKNQHLLMILALEKEIKLKNEENRRIKEEFERIMVEINGGLGKVLSEVLMGSGIDERGGFSHENPPFSFRNNGVFQ